jgi:hypothetical protein
MKKSPADKSDASLDNKSGRPARDAITAMPQQRRRCQIGTKICKGDL